MRVHLQNVVFAAELLKVQQEALVGRKRVIAELRERYDILSFERRHATGKLAGLRVDLDCKSVA